MAKVLSPFSFPVGIFFSQKKRVKGQMFFISAIFMIIGFVMLAGLLTLPEITQEKLFQETLYADKNHENIREEYEYLVGMAAMQPLPNTSGPGYLGNFSNLVRDNTNTKILYVVVFSNGTTKNFTATVGNFLQDSISGDLTFSSGGSSVFSLADKATTTVNFNGTDGIIIVGLNYTIQGTRIFERFVFNDSGKNYAAAFFDITVKESDFLVRSKTLYNRTW